MQNETSLQINKRYDKMSMEESMNFYKVEIIDENFDKSQEFTMSAKTLNAVKQCAGRKCKSYSYVNKKIEIIKVFGYKLNGYGITVKVLLSAWTPNRKWIDF